MTKQVQLRRGTTAEHSSFTGVVGEVTVDITKDTAVVHDGSTAGGHPLVKESDLATVATTGSYSDLSGSPTAVSSFTNDSGYITDYTVTQGDVTAHQAALSITESQISDLQSYLTSIPDNYVLNTGDTMTGALNFGDNVKAQFGASNDLQIYHDTLNSRIQDVGTGNLKIQGTNVSIENSNSSELMIGATDGGAVSLSYAGSTKLATTSTGIDVTGTVTFDGGTTSANLNFGDGNKAIFGASSDFTIHHDQIDAVNKVIGNYHPIHFLHGSEKLMVLDDDADVQLYYNNALKLATTSDGVDITGKITASRGIGATNTYTTTATNLTPNMSTHTNFVWTLDRNITLLSPSTEEVGQSGVFVFIHSGAGRTVSLSSDYETVGGAGLTLSSTAGATDVVPYFVAATNRVIFGQPLLAVS